MAYTNNRSVAGVVGGGAVAGIIAGIVMAMFTMMYAGMMGMGFWMPLRLIAATLFGVDALVGTGGVLFVGLVLHMVVSAVFGIIFAAIVGARTSGAAAVGWGLIYGVAIWAVMGFLVVPVANSTMNPRLPMMAGAFFIEHLLFGITLGITPALMRRFAGREPGEFREVPERRVA